MKARTQKEQREREDAMKAGLRKRKQGELVGVTLFQ
jgi:hypothetical protein